MQTLPCRSEERWWLFMHVNAMSHVGLTIVIFHIDELYNEHCSEMAHFHTHETRSK